MANSAVSFVFGVLTVLVIGAAAYIYVDFTKSETKVANYSAKDVDGDTYIYDKGNDVMEKAIEDTISNNLDEESIPTKNGVVSGMLCYPSSFLPEGEVVAKNTATDVVTSVAIDGTKSDYKIQLEPGTYNLRYQAHASGNDEFVSGYYTKCGIDSTADICDKNDAHDLIPITISAGEVVEEVRLCDFYYTDEPKF